MNKTYIITDKKLGRIILTYDDKVVASAPLHLGEANPILEYAEKIDISEIDEGLQKGITALSYQAEFNLYEFMPAKNKPAVNEQKGNDAAGISKPAKKTVKKEGVKKRR